MLNLQNSSSSNSTPSCLLNQYIQLALVQGLYLQESNVFFFVCVELYKTQKNPHDMRDKQPWNERKFHGLIMAGCCVCL